MNTWRALTWKVSSKKTTRLRDEMHHPRDISIIGFIIVFSFSDSVLSESFYGYHVGWEEDK